MAMNFTPLNLRQTRKAVTAFVGALAFLGASVSAMAQSVVVQGNKRVDADTIRSYVADQSPEAAKKDLLQTGLFANVEVRRSGNQTIVSVRENEVVNRIVFEGNKKLKTEVLVGELQLKERGAFSQTALDNDLARIREIYLRGGRANATVNVRTVTLENGRLDVVYTINEGDKTGVKNLDFVGNHVYSSSRLRDQMTTTESNFMSWLKTSDVYDPDRIAADVELLRRYYLKNGYVDFRVLSTEAQLTEDRSGYNIKITLEEGPQYKIGSVNVDSRINDVPSASLLSLAKTSPGDVYSVDAVDKSLVAMTTSVASRGYAFAQVRPRGDRNKETNTVNIVYVVEEGPRVYIERINVRGNVRTKDEVVRREFDVGEGDAYNKVMVDRAERRLKNLGYFKTVRITNEPGTTPDRVVINVDVEDQPTGQFSISAGYSTADGVIGEVAVSESNLLGRGQYARVSGSLGQYANGVEFNFTEPYFMDRRLAAGFDLFTKYTDNSRYSYYNVRNSGGALRIGFALTEDVIAQIRYTIYQADIKIPNDANHPYGDCSTSPLLTTVGSYAAGIPDCVANGEASVAIKEAAGQSLVSMPGYTLSFNTLDNNKNPRSGIYAEIRQDFAGAGGDAKYIRSTSEVRMYREITDDFVGVVKGLGGYVYGNNLRVIDNFNLGPALVRGFAPGGLGPRDTAVDPRMNALGGTTYFGGSTEVQFPVFGLPKEVGMKMAVFADAGTLFGYEGKKNFGYLCANALTCYGGVASYTQLQVHDSKMIRSSVGTSLIWSSPLGPIRFDFAKAITKDTFDRTQFFRFSGGTSF